MVKGSDVLGDHPSVPRCSPWFPAGSGTRVAPTSASRPCLGRTFRTHGGRAARNPKRRLSGAHGAQLLQQAGEGLETLSGSGVGLFSLLAMNDGSLLGPDGGRLFCVPINPALAQAGSDLLHVFRKDASSAVELPAGAVPGGVWAKEAETLNSMPEGPERDARWHLHQLLVDACRLIWAHALDHIRALEHDLMMSPPPVWSPLTLCRATLEGTAFVGYLCNPAVSVWQRVARAASLRVKEAQNQSGAAAVLGPAEQAAAMRDIAEAEQLVTAAGAIQQVNRRGRLTGYTVEGESAPLDHSISAEIKAFLPPWSTSSYSLVSGAAHGRPWMIARGRSADGSWAGEAATVLAALITIMGALEAGVDAWGSYLGRDVSAVLATMEETRMSFLTDSFDLAYTLS